MRAVFCYCDKELWSLVFLVSERTGITETLPRVDPVHQQGRPPGRILWGEQLLPSHPAWPRKDPSPVPNVGPMSEFSAHPKTVFSPFRPCSAVLGYLRTCQVTTTMSWAEGWPGSSPESVQVPAHSAGEATVCGRWVYDAARCRHRPAQRASTRLRTPLRDLSQESHSTTFVYTPRKAEQHGHSSWAHGWFLNLFFSIYRETFQHWLYIFEFLI